MNKKVNEIKVGDMLDVCFYHKANDYEIWQTFSQEFEKHFIICKEIVENIRPDEDGSGRGYYLTLSQTGEHYICANATQSEFNIVNIEE
jgi:hypothetical protein